VNLSNKVSLLLDSPSQLTYLHLRRPLRRDRLALGSNLFADDLEGGNNFRRAASVEDRPSSQCIEQGECP
jgi:hypothetical protein